MQSSSKAIVTLLRRFPKHHSGIFENVQSSAKPLAALLRRLPQNHSGSLPAFQQPFFKSLSTSEGEPDTHDDFKPVHKAPDNVLSVKEQIEKDIKENPVLLYMKGVPDAPQCGFSSMATRILQLHGVPFAARNILEDLELRQAMKNFSNWPTFPQLYINGEFVGGCDILKKMHESGELVEMLKSVPRN